MTNEAMTSGIAPHRQLRLAEKRLGGLVLTQKLFLQPLLLAALVGTLYLFSATSGYGVYGLLALLAVGGGAAWVGHNIDKEQAKVAMYKGQVAQFGDCE